MRGNGHGTYENKNTWTYDGGEEGYAYAELVTNYRLYSKSYHASDGKLRVHQINRDSVDHRDYPFIEYGEPWGAYEEYWYDALGRRVMKRSRQESPICTSGNRCYSSIERYVWDGDQLLWEARQADAGDSAVPSGSDQTGVAGSVRAGALDAPLAVILNNTAVILHRNWRGLVVDASIIVSHVRVGHSGSLYLAQKRVMPIIINVSAEDIRHPNAQKDTTPASARESCAEKARVGHP